MLTCSSKEKGYPLDYFSAYTWYADAAASGMHKSADRMKSLEQVMLPEQIRIAKSRVPCLDSGTWPRGETRSETEMAKIGAADDLTVQNAEALQAILGIIGMAKVLSFALKRSVGAEAPSWVNWMRRRLQVVSSISV